MKRFEIVELMKQRKVVAILRNVKEKTALELIGLLYECGVGIVEITVERDSGIKLLGEVGKYFKKEINNGEIILGAGTVLNPFSAEKAIAQNARFLVSPCYVQNVVDFAQKNDVIVIPGAFTPTEVYRAQQNDVDFIKIFPAGVLGIAYIKSLLAPFKDVSLFATGGVNLDNFSQYLDAGAFLVGIGSGFVDADGFINYAGLSLLKNNLSSIL